MASNMLDSQRLHGFQYMDEDSINVRLKCNICTEPFVDPGTIWSCVHTFCRACIEKSIRNSNACPMCRQSTNDFRFQKATRNFVNMLDEILVRCEYCNQVNIQRGDFNEHIKKLCPKVVVRCPAGNNSCIWTGPRDQFAIHRTQCTADLSRSFLNQFIAITEKIEQLKLNARNIILQRQQLVSYDTLKSEMIPLDQCCKNLENDNKQLKLQLSELDQQTDLLKKKIPSPRTLTPVRLINVHRQAKWTQNGRIVAGGDDKGTEMYQLCNPYGFYIDDGQVLYIADCTNDRIVKWNHDATRGQLVAGGNGKGNRSDQLNSPTDVIFDKDTDSIIICDYKNRRVVQWPLRYGASGKTIISNIDCHGLAMGENGFLYVTDYQKDEVRRYRMGESHGIVVAGGNGKGIRLNQLNGPIYVAVGRDNSVYVSDEQNHRVMKWREGSKEGIVVAGGHSVRYSLGQLSEPAKIVVDPWHNIYVADWGNHRIMMWPREATQGRVVVGGNGAGKRPGQLHHPVSLAFDLHGNLYVANQWNHQVVKFDIERNS